MDASDGGGFGAVTVGYSARQSHDGVIRDNLGLDPARTVRRFLFRAVTGEAELAALVGAIDRQAGLAVRALIDHVADIVGVKPVLNPI